jgi:DNA modification methylase
MKLKIEYKKIDELIPYINNSRTHSTEQVQQIAASIKEFGWTNPLLLDGENGIIAGHGRMQAAKLLGEKEVPTIQLDGLTEMQKKAYIIADNKLALNAGWDEELLGVELMDLQDAGFDIDIIGFNQNELKKFSDPDLEEGLTEEDEVPETPVEAKTKHGDLYLLGEHRLLCGDSTKEADVKRLLKPFHDVTMHCISDPPYGIAYDPKSYKYGMIKNDDVFLDYIGLAKKYTNGFFFMWTSYQVVDEWIKRIKEEFDKITNLIVWHKGGGGMGDCLKTLATDFEMALVVNRGNEIQTGRIGTMWEYQGDAQKQYINKVKKEELVTILEKMIDGQTVWKVSKDNTSSYMHPTQKPVEVNQKALQYFTKKNDVVVDLFLGSGSNLIACQTMGRIMAGMELDPKYCDVIVQRWEEFTGKKAELLKE